jgi:hypothetical protein
MFLSSKKRLCLLKKMKKRSNINTIYFMIGLPYKIIINYLVINYYNFLVFFLNFLPFDLSRF